MRAVACPDTSTWHARRNLVLQEQGGAGLHVFAGMRMSCCEFLGSGLELSCITRGQHIWGAPGRVRTP